MTIPSLVQQLLWPHKMMTLNPNLKMPEHVFISFSQDDRAIAETIVETLRRNGLTAWIDYSELSPGTPDWEAEIREAIENAFAVVVLASPQSRASRYVRGELSLAESKGCPIFPFWIAGSEWSDCIPLGMTYAQFIDGRGRKAKKGSTELCRVLEQHIKNTTPSHYLVNPLWRHVEGRRPATHWMSQGGMKITCTLPPPGFLSVEITEENSRWDSGGSAVFVRISDYPNIHSFLDDLYLGYLTEQFKPFTYGSNWILEEQSHYCARLLAPWLWLTNQISSSEMPSEWLHHIKLGDCGLQPGTIWRVRKPNELNPTGLATNDKRIWKAIQLNPKAQYLLRIQKILLDRPVAEVDDTFQYHFIFSAKGFFGQVTTPGTAMVQSEKELPEHIIQHWLKKY